MKRFLLPLVILCLPILGFGQELQLNPNNKFYEYSLVTDNSTPPEVFKNRLEQLNYKNITINENILKGEGFTNHLVSGTANVEIHYNAKYEFKGNKYRLILTGFTLTDKNGSSPLEGMGAFKKKWVKIINSKLPDIVAQLQKPETKTDW